MGCCSSSPSPDVAHQVLADDGDDGSEGSGPVNDHGVESFSSDDVPDGLSYVGGAAHLVLRWKHAHQQGLCWNLTHGRVVGKIAQTPSPESGFFHQEQTINQWNEFSHSDEFPLRIGEIIARAEEFVDIASLGVPDGKFLASIVQALRKLDGSGKRITVRFLTGNIIGMPTDNTALINDLTNNPEGALSQDSNIRLWAGSWRKGLSWNHAKIVAVDGKYLLQGGHNLWDAHYLKTNPVRDVSMEVEGQVTHDAHAFCNRMWKYIQRKEIERIAQEGDLIPSFSKANTSVFSWPLNAEAFPPVYDVPCGPLEIRDAIRQGDVPMLTIGRYGNLHRTEHSANPSDSAIREMLASAKKSIKMSLQDLGPIAVPLPTGTVSVPGGVWPEEYLQAIAGAIYHRGVNVHILLSAPNSIPADLTPVEANYGNGWTCEDVASEVVKSMMNECQDECQDILRELVILNLHVTYMRTTKGSKDWSKADGKAGNHSKLFIVDDICYYMGSQNLYIADLAEWGIVVDDEAETTKLLKEYWNPLWKISFDNVPVEYCDCNIDKVLAGCSVDRRLALNEENLTAEEKEAVILKMKANFMGGDLNRLAVWISNAEGLKSTDKDGKSDPYVVARLVDADGVGASFKQKTKVAKSCGENPTWNEQLVFEGLPCPTKLFLELTVVDKDTTVLGLGLSMFDRIVSDDALGHVTLSLDDLLRVPRFQERTLNLEVGSLLIGLCTFGEWGQ